VDPADRPVLGEPSLARGLVGRPSARRSRRAGYPFDNGRADPAAKTLSNIPASHVLIIGRKIALPTVRRLCS